MRILLIAFVAAFLSTSAYSRTTGCWTESSQFLSHPSARTLAIIEKDERCWNAVSANPKARRKLYTLVSDGNRWSAAYLVKHIVKLDGGELEDAIRALGAFGDRNSVQLLLFSKGKVLSKSQLIDAVTALPANLTDEPRRQLRFMVARRARYASVHREGLQRQRATALAEIDTFIAEIRSHM